MSDLDGRTSTDRWLGGMSAPDGGYTQEQRGRAGEALMLLERLRARVRELENGLRWYAEARNWCDYLDHATNCRPVNGECSCGGERRNDAEEDHGRRARRLLGLEVDRG